MTMKSFLTLSICLTALCHCTLTQAALTIVPILGGGPLPLVNYVNFDDIALGSNIGATTFNTAASASAGFVTVNSTTNAQVVTGPLAGQYAEPWVTLATQGVPFAHTQAADGDDESQYITSGSTGSTAGAEAELVFGTLQSYFGILWGSVDDYNTLTFYNGLVSVGTIVGTQVDAVATGDQGVLGTFYVNIDSSLPFDRVVATSTAFAFEFDDVAYGENRIIPEATTIVVWSALSLIGVMAYRRRSRLG